MSEAIHPYHVDERREHVAHWTRFYSQRSENLYRPGRLSGADYVDAERYRLIASALRRVLLGHTADEAVEWFRGEYRSWQSQANAKVDAAPKIRPGPMAGQSSIHYKYVSDCKMEEGEGIIRRVCNGNV